MTQGTVEVKGLSYAYARAAAKALSDVDLTVSAGEFFSLLGPSGCGKTTLLRSIAGFVRPSAGQILLDGVDVTGVPPHRRPVNLVFQRPTLFPHLDVGDNVAFGLRLRRVSRAERLSRVQEMLDLVRLGDFAHRRVHQLSGGQMQRVALARALVNRPKVLLLDEPLSALDLAIRLELEVELRRVHRETEATFVYVTHDQREAMALSDRLAVFASGRIAQLGTPQEVYREPASEYVARFVGDANVLACDIRDGAASINGRVIATGVKLPDGPGTVVLRREDVAIRAIGAATEGPELTGIVIDIGFRGNTYTYRVRCAEVGAVVRCEQSGDAVPLGTRVALTWPEHAAQVLSAAS